MKPFATLMVAFLFLSLSALAGTVEDAIKLSKAGLSEEVIVAWADAQVDVSLSGPDIVRLHESKVPDRAIVALVKRSSKAERAEPAERVVVRAAEPVVVRTVEEPAPVQVVYSYSPAYYPSYSYCYPYRTYAHVGYPYRYGYPHMGVSLGFSFGSHHRR
jgi:hypothetical protein